MEINNVENYDYKQWVYIKNKLNSITFNRFSCFFNNHILKNKTLFEEFAVLLSDNFNLISTNWEVINGTDFTLMAGGWKNGEISMNKGLSEMLNPELYGKDPKSTVAISDGLKSFLNSWGLFSRSINCTSSSGCCDCGCGCEMKALVECSE